MTCNIKRNPSAMLAAGLAISAFLVLGNFVASANAQERRDEHRGADHRNDRDRGGWTGGYYYPPPPVVYAPPYYAPPPVVYGPAVGVMLPGLDINIR